MLNKLISICLVFIVAIFITASVNSNKYKSKIITKPVQTSLFSKKDLNCIEFSLKKIQSKNVFNGNLPTDTSCVKVNQYFNLINSSSLTPEWSEAFLYLLEIHPELLIQNEDC